MGLPKHIPPHTFDALYRFYKFGHQPGDFLGDLLAGDIYFAACRADAQNHQYFADIIIFINQYASQVSKDNDMFNFKWETWRSRFSPDATEISFHYEDPDD
jgi:hypothetical protein